MSSNYGSTWLLKAVQRLESVAASSQTFNDEDVIEFLNLELQSTVVPTVQSVNEEFGVYSYDVPVGDLTDAIQIPSQATGQRLRSVQLVTSDGRLLNLPRLDPDVLGRWNTGWGFGYYLKNNSLIFYPRKPSGSYVLRLNYFRRPNVLVKETACGRILSIDTLGNTVTLDTSPDPSWSPGNTVDLIAGQAPFDFVQRAVQIVNVTGPIVELPAASIALLSVGDYVALEGESPVAQFVPLEALYYLAQLAGARCLQALGDTEGHQLAMNKAEMMKQALLNMISDRVQGNPMKVVTRPITRRGAWNWGY